MLIAPDRPNNSRQARTDAIVGGAFAVNDPVGCPANAVINAHAGVAGNLDPHLAGEFCSGYIGMNVG
jgi:hypothetical protein